MTDVTPTLGRPFRGLWTAAAVSNLADGALRVALPLIAVGLTRSPLLIAGLSVAMTLPWLLFSLPAGALVDRVDRRRAMQVAQTVRVAALVVLAALLTVDLASIWVLYVVAIVVGAAETVYDTAAPSLLPQVVAPAALPRANGRIHGAELVGQQFVGRPLGGLLVTAGAAVAVLAPAALWVVAIGALLLVPGHFRAARDDAGPAIPRMRTEIVEGLRFVVRHRVMSRLAVLGGVLNLANSMHGAVLVLFAVGAGSAMGLSGAAFGLLLAAGAVGGVLGSFVAARIHAALGDRWTFVASVAVMTVLPITPALTADVTLNAVALAVGGAGAVLWNVNSVSLRQRVTPAHLMGRVHSAFRLLATGLLPVGALLGGVIGEVFGVRAAFVVASAVTLAVLGALFVGLRAVDVPTEAAAGTAETGGTETGRTATGGAATGSAATGSAAAGEPTRVRSGAA